jgi:hypothetical protein
LAEKPFDLILSSKKNNGHGRFLFFSLKNIIHQIYQNVFKICYKLKIILFGLTPSIFAESTIERRRDLDKENRIPSREGRGNSLYCSWYRDTLKK